MPQRKSQRYQVTVYLEQVLYDAAKAQADKAQCSLSAAITEAARQTLLKSYRDERQGELLKAVDRNFYAFRRTDKVLRFELFVLKEMLGLILRVYLNHTPPVPEAQWDAASRSGRIRFGQFLDMLAENIRGNRSILNDVMRDIPAVTDEESPPAPVTAGSAGEHIEEATITQVPEMKAAGNTLPPDSLHIRENGQLF
jgi:hypothetical protein